MPEPVTFSGGCRPAGSGSARSTPAGWAASTRCSRCCCWPRSSRSRCARTPAAWACPSTSEHLSLVDYIAVSGRLEDRRIEFVDELHEHFLHPARIRARPLPGARGPRIQHRDAPGRSPSTRSHGDPPSAQIGRRADCGSGPRARGQRRRDRSRARARRCESTSRSPHSEEVALDVEHGAQLGGPVQPLGERAGRRSQRVGQVPASRLRRPVVELGHRESGPQGRQVG